MTSPNAYDLARNGSRNITIVPGIFGMPTLVGMPMEVQIAPAAGVPCPSLLGTPEDYAKHVRHIIENEMPNGDVIRLDGRFGWRRSRRESLPGSGHLQTDGCWRSCLCRRL